MLNQTRWLVLVVPLVGWTVGMASAQIGESPGAGRVNVSLEMSNSSYKVGDPVEFTVRTDKDAWVYVLSTDAHGTTRQIFPNGYHRDNLVRASRPVSLPDSSYTLVASEPRGAATLSAFATTEKYDWLREYEISGGGEAFPVRRVEPVQFHSRLEQSVTQASRSMDAPRQSVPARSALTGGPAPAVESVGYRHSYPSFGFYSRRFTIILGPPPPPIVIHDPYPVYEPLPRYEPVYVPPPPVVVYPRPVYVYPRYYSYNYCPPTYFGPPRHHHSLRRPDYGHRPGSPPRHHRDSPRRH